jgi:tripartite-type tricarboxylate transporter receptor subunit TctC
MAGERAMTRRRFGASGLATIMLGAAAMPAAAQGDAAATYPAKAIRLIVGFAPGGANDLLARIVGQKLSERLGQPVLVENKPGAGAAIATEFVAKAPPDGHTLLVGATGAMTINPAVYSKLAYDTVRDFTPVSMIASFPLLLTVNASAPARTVAELVAYAKANPAKANYASASASFQLATELFKMRTGAPLEHIAYKGSGESMTALISGEVLVALADSPPVSGHLKSGKARALAVTSAERMREYPDVPTMAEAGVADLEVRLWSGVFAPAATPPAIVKKLEKEIVDIVKQPDVRERLAGLSVDPVGDTSEAFARTIAAELARWSATARAANIKLD